MANRDALDWCDQNMHTSYPLAASAVAQSKTNVYLPQSLLVDFQLVIPQLIDADARERFFISSVSTTDSLLYIDISYRGSSTGNFRCATVGPVPLSLRNVEDLDSRTFPLIPDCTSIPEAYEPLKTLSGHLIIGSCVDMPRNNLLEFQFKNTELLGLCVFQTYNALNSITVVDQSGNSTTCTNDITLQAGDGIDFDVVSSIDSATKQPVYTVTVKHTQDALEDTFASLDDVLNAVNAYIGTPIKRINGIGPDANGNFTISTGDCLKLEDATNGVTLSNPCARPCCDELSISDVKNALKLLEEAQHRLESEYASIATNINGMQSRLAILIANNNSN